MFSVSFVISHGIKYKICTKKCWFEFKFCERCFFSSFSYKFGIVVQLAVWDGRYCKWIRRKNLYAASLAWQKFNFAWSKTFFQKKTLFMLVPIVWWALLICFWICYVLYSSCGVDTKRLTHKIRSYVYTGTNSFEIN